MNVKLSGTCSDYSGRNLRRFVDQPAHPNWTNRLVTGLDSHQSGKITGVALTGGEWVEDLWVAANARGVGVGLALSSRCEIEIRERGIRRARLRNWLAEGGVDPS